MSVNLESKLFFSHQLGYEINNDKQLFEVVEKVHGKYGLDLFQKLLTLLRASGANIEYNKGKYKITNITLEDLYSLVISHNDLVSVNYFSPNPPCPVFNYNNETFLFTIVDLPSTTPILNYMLGQLPLPKLQLPYGKVLTEDEFCTHPLIAHLPEKREIFRKLIEVFFNVDNINSYYHFIASQELTKLKYEFKNFYIKYAVFSFAAYFENKIDREELFIINVVLEAYKEFDLRNKIFDISVKTLDKTNIAEYLKEAKFPLFSDIGLKNGKEGEELEKERIEFIEKFGGLSAFKRTVVDYDVFRSSHHILEEDLSIEQLIHKKNPDQIGFKQISDLRIRVNLLGPELALDIFRRASGCNLPNYNEYNVIFGFSPDETPFFKGLRSISIPSPLISMPSVHQMKGGPKGLGILAHDINYHMPLEAINPHRLLFAKLAKKLKKIADLLFSENTVWSRACSFSASGIADREFNIYKTSSPNHAFVKSLMKTVVLFSAQVAFLTCEGKSKMFSPDFICWFKEIYAPLVLRYVGKLGSNSNEEETVEALKLTEIYYNFIIKEEYNFLFD